MKETLEMRKTSQDKIKLPFTIKYIQYLGKEKRVIERTTLNILELRGIVNMASIELKNSRVGENGIDIELGSVFSGRFLLNLSLDQYAELYNLLKDFEKKTQGHQAQEEREEI